MQSEPAVPESTLPPKEHEPIKVIEEQPKEAQNDINDEKHAESTTKGCSGGSIDRDVVLANVMLEKKHAIIKAWEESEKAKADNKANKKLSFLNSWEVSEKAAVEVQLSKIQEKLEKRKAEYAEKMKNKIAEIHKKAEEKRAIVEASKRGDFLKLEEMAAKSRATGQTPKKTIGCFSCKNS
uniref:Remorin C-terminal domain-containing protein n=1 Tax=Fagus sylvatica TaxID=28930 RepID=A0A2N9J0Y3_FAGSY